MLLYIIRHGDPNYALDTLTERGKLQAESVGRRMKAVGIDRIFSSPMGRARETAAPACRLLGLTAEIEDWTEEISYAVKSPFPDGVIKSLSTVQNSRFRENGYQNLDYDHAHECQGFCDSRMKEAADFLEAHGRDFLARLGYREEGGIWRITRPNDEKIALFCHAAFTRAWLSVLLRIPIHMMWSGFQFTHTGVTVLEFRNYENGETAPQMLTFSDISHLYADGLDTIHNNHIEI